VAPPTRVAAFRSFWAPNRLGFSIAVFFAIGASHFLVAALAATWPEASPAFVRDARTQAWVFFAGSLFFTCGAWLQWLEALNGDVARSLEATPPSWRWFGWHPRNLGYLACSMQLAGTLFFNVNTANGLIQELTWREQELLIWGPNMLGSICFLLASYLAYAEISHGAASFEPHSVSWWVAVINLLGSVAFQLSALDSFVTSAPSPAAMVFSSNLLTAIGALCFLIGSYLLIPELFDSDRAGSRKAGFSPMA